MRYGSSRRLSTSSACAVSFSSSSYDCSGVVNFTSSTLSNWCCRIRPRTSCPYDPASLRKQGVYAVYEIGRSRPSRISPRCRFVSGTSAVGTRYRSQSPAILNRSASNFGRLPVPVSDGAVDEKRRLHLAIAMLARVQVEHEVDERARQPRAAPLRTEKRAPAIFDAALEVEDAELGTEIPVRLRLEIERPRLAVAAHFAVVVGALARPARVGVRQVGQRQQRRLALMLDGVELDAELLDLLRARAVRLLDRRRVVTLTLGARDLVARRVLLPLQSLELRDDPTPARSRAWRSPRGSCLDRARGCAARRGPLRCDHGRTSGSSMEPQFYLRDPRPRRVRPMLRSGV